MDALNHLGLRYISPVDVEIKIEETFVAGLELMHTGDTHHAIKILEVDIEVTLIIEEAMGIILEVVRDTGTIIMITGGIIIEVKIMVEIGSRSLERQDRSRRRDRSVSNGRSRSGSRA